ncbi:MAG TPA: glycoside hydrolase family 32 protein [Herpetosiphonaceae bacterium]
MVTTFLAPTSADLPLTAAAGDTDLRPLFHFTPQSNWINDPNGLVYYAGEYHLFYQYHPYSLVWGPMYWGHAVSRDLVSWEHLPTALAPDELGMIFSGSAVIDWHNTAGFGPATMVAMFTQFDAGQQVQSLAFSTDRGRSWTKYAGNPVIAQPAEQKDFRDPKVFWHGDQSDGHWVMLLAVGQEIWFYTSPDLKTWAKSGEFGAGFGANGGVWETPDLFQLPVDGNPDDTHWVLIVAVQDQAPAGGSGVQYFVGDFDGGTFIPGESPEVVRWADYGGDFYAAQSWSDAPNGRRTWLAWMNNWSYGAEIPATTWRGAMTVPRDLALASDGDSVVLVQQPVAEVAKLRGVGHHWSQSEVQPGVQLLEHIRGATLEVQATFAVDQATTARSFGLRVRAGADEATVIGYDAEQQALFVDRSSAGHKATGTAGPQIVPLQPRTGEIVLRLLIDHSSVEVFADGGRVVLTNQVFPAPTSTDLELFAEAGSVKLKQLSVYPLHRQHV